MWAIHQGFRFAGDKSRKADLLTGRQEPQAQQLRPRAAWLKVNLVQDVGLWGPRATMQGMKGPGESPFDMHLASVCGQRFPSGHLPDPQNSSKQGLQGLENDTATWAPVAQELAWNRPFDLQIQIRGRRGYFSQALPCLAWTTCLEEAWQKA